MCLMRLMALPLNGSLRPGRIWNSRCESAGERLATLETATPLADCDMIGFTLQYELSYTNILNMLNLADVPLYACDRDEHFRW